jgi:hypothetical protein
MYALDTNVETNCAGLYPVVEKMDISWDARVMGEVGFDYCASQSIRFDLPSRIIRKIASNKNIEFKWIPEKQLTAGPAEKIEVHVEINSMSFLLQKLND